MKIEVGPPPNYDQIVQAFPWVAEKLTDILFAYGDTIYVSQFVAETILPNRPDLIVHEEVHSRQQGKKPRKWWQRYIEDAEFRIEQEIEAYAHQWAWSHGTNMSANRRGDLLEALAWHLSGPLYGYAISFHAAERSIKLTAEKLLAQRVAA